MATQQANYQLKNILDKFAKDYQTTAEASRVAFMQSAKGGDMIPAPGHIYGNDYKARFEDRCREYQTEAETVLTNIIADARAKATEAPSAEAVRVVQMLQLREDLTADEVNNLLSVYGDNAQAYKAIASVAASKDVHVPPCPIDEELKALEDLQRDMAKTLTLSSAESGHTTDSFLSFFASMNIDPTLPTEK